MPKEDNLLLSMMDGDHGSKYVGDSKTWKLSLDVYDVEVPEIPDFILEHADFCIRRQGGHHPRAHYSVRAD